MQCTTIYSSSLLRPVRKKDITMELQQVCSFYKYDFQLELLQAQSTIFGNEFQCAQRDSAHSHIASIKTPTIFDIKDYFTSLTSAQRFLLSQVCSAVKLILVMPAINSTSERSFSTLVEWRPTYGVRWCNKGWITLWYYMYIKRSRIQSNQRTLQMSL